MSRESGMGRRAIIGVLLLGLLAVAVGARVRSAEPIVFRPDGEVRLLGTDAYFHLRQARYSAANFPHIQRWDVGTGFPRGEYANTPGLYDLALAGTALALGGGQAEESTIRSVAAWSAPILGALALLVLFLLLARVARAETGLLACVFLSLYPGTFILRTSLGFADHHAAEVLLVLLSAWGAAACFSKRPARGVRAVGRGLWRAAPLAALLFTWAGGALVLLLVGLMLFLVITVGLARRLEDPGLGGSLLRYGVGVFVWVALGSLAWPDLVMVPEVWPALLVSCGLLGPVLWAYWTVAQRLAGRGVPGPAIAVAALLLLVVAVGGAAMLVPGVDAWTTRILGMQTELVSELAAEVTSASYWQILGVPGALALIAPIVCLGVAWQKEGELPALFLSLLAVAFLGMWWRTHDFDYLVPVVSAMAAALAVRGLWITMLPERVSVRNLLYAGAAVLALAPIWPLGKQPVPWPTRADVGQLMLLSEGWVQAMAWMAEHTPEPPLPVGARVEPFGDDFDYPPGSYGVLTAWDHGNFVSALGRRPVVVSQGVSPSLARWMMETDEGRSLRFWDRVRQEGEPIRYVVLDAETLGDHFGSFIEGAGLTAAEFVEQPSPGAPPIYGARYRESIVGRLFIGAADGLRHYRLVYQSPQESALFYRARPRESGQEGSGRVRLLRRSEAIDTAEERARFEELQAAGVTRTEQGYLYRVTFVPTVRIFEVVPGATLVGAAAPGTEVEIRLDLASTSDGAALEYRQRAVAGEDGRYRLTVPYSTEPGGSTAVAATGRYRLSAGSNEGRRDLREVDVAEVEVRSGAEILLDETEESR